MKTQLSLRAPLRPLRLCGHLLLFPLAATAAPASKAPAKPASKAPVTRTASGQTIITSAYGNGTRTTDSSGKSWTTTRYGNGTITKGPDGSSYTTSRYGNGTITKGTGTPPPVIPALPKK